MVNGTRSLSSPGNEAFVLLSAPPLSTDRTPITRSPDDAKIKAKMLFASSKDALRRSLVGIAAEIQGTDYSEVAYESGAWPLCRL